MSSLNGLASPMNTRMYGCHTICQNPMYFTATSGPPSQCQACLGVAKNTPYGCENCLRVLSSSDDRQGCIDCLARDPTNGKRPDYMWACAQCMRIPVTDGARAQCLACISTDMARLISDGGMLPAEEAGSDVRDNDFGACVVLANRTYNIGQGSVEIDGVFANCVPKGYAAANPKPFLPLGLHDCMSCVETVLQSTPRGPSFLHKEYACSAYCQDPNAFPFDLTDTSTHEAAEDLAAACVDCVKNSSVVDAWGCGNW
jgi:hypothetical protein